MKIFSWVKIATFITTSFYLMGCNSNEQNEDEAIGFQRIACVACENSDIPPAKTKPVKSKSTEKNKTKKETVSRERVVKKEESEKKSYSDLQQSLLKSLDKSLEKSNPN